MTANMSPLGLGLGLGRLGALEEIYYTDVVDSSNERS